MFENAGRFHYCKEQLGGRLLCELGELTYRALVGAFLTWQQVVSLIKY
jgi:hypothetical protein